MKIFKIYTKNSKFYKDNVLSIIINVINLKAYVIPTKT